MNAADIARALRGHRNGDGYVVRCPVASHGQGHGDRSPSLSVHNGDGGKLLVRCFAGCDARDVLAELRRRGLEDSTGRAERAAPVPREPKPIAPNPAALAIWRASTPVAGTLAGVYLRARGITSAPPPSLRFHKGLKYFDGNGPGGGAIVLPALVAAVQAPDRRVVAVQRTFLDPRGDRKASVSTPRKGLGSYHGGAVRLGAAGSVLGFAEGVEDALSAMQLAGVTTWAAAGIGRMASIVLPPAVREVHVFGNNDEPGRIGAERAAEAFAGQGRRVVLRFPPEGMKDFNDVARATAREAAA